MSRIYAKNLYIFHLLQENSRQEPRINMKAKIGHHFWSKTIFFVLLHEIMRKQTQ